MNQLQNLLHDALISTNHVEKCALIKKSDGSLKAFSIGFQPSPEDIQTLIDAFENTTRVRDKGIYFDEYHYRCIRADDDAIYAKEVIVHF